MTYKEYFEGLGCSPDEVQVCTAAAKARFARQLDTAAATVVRGDILSGDPHARELDHLHSERKEAGL